MRAIWSFWSKPFEHGIGWGWEDPAHHLLAWGLSVRLASRHFLETELVTDSHGKALLVDGLGLRFTSVSTALDRLADTDPDIWALGKLAAYAAQPQPFVHLDADVFLWRPLPASLITAPVLAQHPERWSAGDLASGPELVEDAFARAGVVLPAEWEWARSRWGAQVNQANCGVVGGTNVAFIRYYANLALDLVLGAEGARVWCGIAGKAALTAVVEQFMLSACLEFHRSHPYSPFKGVHARYLFPSAHAAFDPGQAARLGFTHLLADSKADPRVVRRLEQRVRREDRDLYSRCVRMDQLCLS